MIRRLNYTGRLRIRRRDIRITVRERNGAIEFDADLSRLATHGLPPEGLVFVEVYRQTSWMRFSFGRVGAIEQPAKRLLEEFDTVDGILFRVKVTSPKDANKLLAEADRIPLVKPEQQESEKRPLLPVKPQKLGDEIYRVDFSGDRPILLINKDVGDYSSIAMHPAFFSLVYPAVMREVLIKVLVIDKHDDEDSKDDWRSEWLRFARLSPGLGGLPKPEEIEDRSDWVERAVESFARRMQLATKFVGFWRLESDR